jgi:hypothetical protein
MRERNKMEKLLAVRFYNLAEEEITITEETHDSLSLMELFKEKTIEWIITMEGKPELEPICFYLEV